jgi:hypothetical protein
VQARFLVAKPTTTGTRPSRKLVAVQPKDGEREQNCQRGKSAHHFWPPVECVLANQKRKQQLWDCATHRGGETK